MRRISHSLIMATVLLLFISGTGTLTSATSVSPEERSSVILEEKTLRRWPDPIVADCGLFPSLLGKKVGSLRIYVHSDDSFHPIPFQIDERDSEGQLVLPSGEKGNPEDANGLMDKGPRPGSSRRMGLSPPPGWGSLG